MKKNKKKKKEAQNSQNAETENTQGLVQKLSRQLDEFPALERAILQGVTSACRTVISFLTDLEKQMTQKTEELRNSSSQESHTEENKEAGSEQETETQGQARTKNDQQVSMH